MPTAPTPERSVVQAPVTLILITCMLLATLPGLSFPKVDKLFNPASELPYFWQFITGSFTHGWAFLPPLIHLSANLALFFFVGPWTERLLGSARYLLLMLAAILAAGLVRRFPDFGPPGASAFILACGPVLFYRWTAIRTNPDQPAYRKLWLGLLVLGSMLAVPLVYGTWLAHQSSSPLLAILQANAVHLTAFVVGGLAVLVWRPRLVNRRLPETGFQATLDRVAAISSGLLPTAMVILIVLGALKKL